MEEFTKAEIERINQLYGTDFEGITPADALLIGRFEASKAVSEEKFKAEMEALEKEAASRVQTNAEIAATAIDNLNSLCAMAMERLERIDNEQ